MNVFELNRAQYIELCQSYIAEFWTNDEFGCCSPSLDDLIRADELVSPATIYAYYSGIDFTEDDFFCSSDCEEDVANKISKQFISSSNEENPFAKVSWCDIDIIDLLGDYGYKPTEANIAKIRNSIDTEFLESVMIETGWNYLNTVFNQCKNELEK